MTNKFALIVLALLLALPPSQALAQDSAHVQPDLAAQLLSGIVEHEVEVSTERSTYFTPNSVSMDSDFLEVGETYPLATGVLDAGESGAWFFSIVEGDAESAVAAWQDDGEEQVTYLWTLPNDAPTLAAASDARIATTASSEAGVCEDSVNFVGGGAAALGCAAIPGAGPLIVAACGGVGAVAGGYATDFVCAPNENERMATRLTCNVDFCTVEGEIYTYGLINSIDAYVWWDISGRDDFLLGPSPCRPACGNHSITYHFGNDFRVQRQEDLYIVDVDSQSARRMHVYTVTGRLNGSPACFVDNTKAVYASYHVDTVGSSDLFGDNGVSKPWSYCPY